MKRKIIIVLLTIFTSASVIAQTGNNQELIEIYNADQRDRMGSDMSWEKWLIISKRDSSRQVRVYELLDSNKVVTSVDYQNAAMIFQHGDDTISSGMTIQLMKRAIELDSTINKWLLAAAIDRDLKRKHQPQIYGTQYRKIDDGPWFLHDIDTTVITDEERIEYNVETLAEQRQRVIEMNKPPLSEYLNDGKTIGELTAYCKNIIDNNLDSEYSINENSLTDFGYELMFTEKVGDALKIFNFIAKQFPESYNAFDSLGECLLLLGKTEEGIMAYKKSLELNPKNENAKSVLDQYK